MAEWLVEIKVLGNFSGVHAAATAGVGSARAWEAGDLITQGALLRYTRGGFVIASPLPPEAALVDHVDAVLARLRDVRLARVEPPPDVIDLSCVLYLAPGERPEIALRSDQVRQLSDIGAAFDIDLYPDYLDGLALP